MTEVGVSSLWDTDPSRRLSFVSITMASSVASLFGLLCTNHCKMPPVSFCSFEILKEISRIGHILYEKTIKGGKTVERAESSKTPDTFQSLLTVFRGIINITMTSPVFHLSLGIPIQLYLLMVGLQLSKISPFVLLEKVSEQLSAELKLVDEVQTIAKKSPFLVPDNIFQPPL